MTCVNPFHSDGLSHIYIDLISLELSISYLKGLTITDSLN